MKGLFRQTEREKRGTLAAMNLFFGALLGANLGTIGAASASDYVLLVTLIGGAVSSIYVALASERRRFALTMLAFYAALIGFALVTPGRALKSVPEADFQRIVLTLGIWVVFAAVAELSPTISSADPAPKLDED